MYAHTVCVPVDVSLVQRHRGVTTEVMFVCDDRCACTCTVCVPVVVSLLHGSNTRVLYSQLCFGFSSMVSVITENTLIIYLFLSF